jgi:D-alanyl-D-alanine carboxypeptidase/D-alanyl-D-alanine-endopeptidase (penicillin-binding protein 4)
LNRRLPIVLIFAVGICLIAALCYIPFSLARQLHLEQAMTAFVPAPPPPPSASSVAVKPASQPDFDVAAWYAERGEAPETHGALIESLDHQHLYAAHNADETFNPASLMKLATSLVALKKLGADYRFQTQVYVDGKTDDGGTLRGRVYVVGSDPVFGDVGANLIARELKARGIRKISEGVSVSPDFSFNFSESPTDSAARLVKAIHLGNVSTDVANATSGELLCTLKSYTLRDLLLYMNARSSNFVAEKIGALIGGPDGVAQFLVGELHLPPEQVKVSRVSGREHNLLTPRGLLAVIRALVEEAQHQNLEPSDIMPVASDDSGTLRRRLAGTGLEGAVVGKTGTLTQEVDGGMASLAGIVYTQNDGIVVFAILDQGNRINDNRQLEDQLLAEVVSSRMMPRAVGSPTPRPLLPASGIEVEKP